MKVLVIGSTGTVGSAVVEELKKRGASVFGLTRNAERAKEMPSGVTGVVGDLLDPASLGVFKGMDGVFLLNPVGPTEAHEGLMAVNGARAAHVHKLVYMSVHDLDKASHLPHFGCKIGVEFAVRHSGIHHTILRPNNFYQNDVWMKQALLEYGVYPQPVGSVGVSRVDVRDIAEAAAVALTTDKHDGEIYNLVGPEAVTGESTAADWSRALGRPIKYAGDDLEAWEAQNRPYLPASTLFDFKLMYAFFQAHGLKASGNDIARQTALIGRAPRKFSDYAAEMAAAWRAG
jgi:uncharacterized protein YbjT (DUF2867 family)